jgi:predicted heme/steroid binding protein
MPEEHVFSVMEIRKFDGSDGPMYIAYKGIVYDVSESRRWKTGLHEGLHFPAQDLTGEMEEAPHSEEVLLHLGIIRVGVLKDDIS